MAALRPAFKAFVSHLCSFKRLAFVPIFVASVIGQEHLDALSEILMQAHEGKALICMLLSISLHLTYLGSPCL